MQPLFSNFFDFFKEMFSAHISPLLDSMEQARPEIAPGD